MEKANFYASFFDGENFSHTTQSRSVLQEVYMSPLVCSFNAAHKFRHMMQCINVPCMPAELVQCIGIDVPYMPAELTASSADLQRLGMRVLLGTMATMVRDDWKYIFKVVTATCEWL